MRLISLLPLVVAFTSFAASCDPETDATLQARELIDGLATRGILSEYSTRDLADELNERLQRRGSGNSVPSFKCPYCGSTYATFAEVSNVNINGFSVNADHEGLAARRLSIVLRWTSTSSEKVEERIQVQRLRSHVLHG
ncbi:hypothetical protein B0H34DRAFT_436877 [Crassisporium funariophilum]|nr:hypothetical protein B0H34DRAFT_436877 [Crassisporium funariophilum]